MYLAIGCLVQARVPFLRAIGRLSTSRFPRANSGVGLGSEFEFKIGIEDEELPRIFEEPFSRASH